MEWKKEIKLVRKLAIERGRQALTEKTRSGSGRDERDKGGGKERTDWRKQERDGRKQAVEGKSY